MIVLLFFTSFLFYLCGLGGTVPAYRDSGDLIASIHTLGIAHPPGYALYILLGKLFVTVMPFGNVAYRVNVMSALFAAITAVLLWHVLRRWSKTSSWVAFVLVAVYATSPAVVALARVAEMYTLSACLAAAILYGLLSDHPNGPQAAAFLLGVGLSVHPTLIFLAPLFFAVPAHPPARRSMLFFLLGLSVFLYLPLRASQHPLLNWGDPSSWRNFWRVVTRADYGGLRLHPEQSVFSWTPTSILVQLQYFLIALKGEWGWAGFMLGFLGMGVVLQNPKTRRWGVMLGISWGLSGPGFFLLSNLPLREATTPAILQPYLLLVSLLWAPFVLSGCQVLASLRGPRLLVPALTALLLVSTRSWAWTSERNDFYAYDYARNLMRSLPVGAVLYDPDDPTHFSIEVLQTVEKRRSDIILLSFFRTRWGYEQIKRRWPDLLPPIPIENGQELQRLLWAYSARRRPFYAELPQKLGKIPYQSQGLVYAVRLTPSSDDEAVSRTRAETLLALYSQRGDFVTTHHSDFFTRHVISYYSAAYNNLGIEYANRGDWERAIAHYKEALRLEPDQPAAQSNLAFALQKMRKLI